MPWVDAVEDLPRRPEGVAPPEELRPTGAQTLGAAFGQDNLVVNAYRRLTEEHFPPEPDHNPLDVIRGTRYETHHLDNFLSSRSEAETRQIMARIDREDEERRILGASGAAGFVAQAGAGLLDPTILLPGGVVVKSARGGYSVGRTALATAAAAAAQTGVQEAGLQGMQETRTAGESALSVASSAILGAILGGGASALLSRGERAALEGLLDRDRAALDAHAVGSPLPAAAGAEAVERRQLELFKTPLDIGPLKKLSVTRRVLQAEAVEARRVMADLAETPYRFRENEAGIATSQGPAVDRVARIAMNGARVEAGDELERLFSQYRFGEPDVRFPQLKSKIEGLLGSNEGKMSYGEFKREVSIAMQQGDQHAVPEVANAAQYLRRNIFDPWAERAEKAIEGFKRADQAEGEAWFPHHWNKERIKAQRPEFTNKLVEYYRDDQSKKRAAQLRLEKLSADLEGARGDLAKAKEPGVIAAAQKIHDDAMVKIEEEIAAWEGKSVSEAKTAIKARETYGQKRAEEKIGTGPVDRLESADKAIDRVIKRILESDLERPISELRDRANQTVDRILGSPDGRLPYDQHMGGPRIGFHEGPPPRGSLAERQLMVSNAWARDWIEQDIEHVVNNYLRTFVPDTLLAERFGNTEMTEAFRKIQESYANLIDATKAERERTRLGRERDAVIRDVAAVRDRIRHVYGWSQDSTVQNAARLANGAKAVNNLVNMGTSALSSLPDLAGTALRYGVTSSIRDGWAPFFKGLVAPTEEWGKFKSQMRSLGIGVETAINARQHALDDVVDVYRPQSRFERTLQGASDKFFIANMLAPLTDAQKMIAAHVATSEIVKATRAVAEGKATKRQIGNLAESGIDIQMAGRIWREFNELKRGSTTGGVYLPNTADWNDRAAADALSGAISRETDIMVVTPGQEKALWMSKPVLSLLGQFKAFTASATERILLANLQRRDAAALSGVIFSVGLGMLAYKLNSFFGGQKTSDRPQDWFKEGVARGGLLGWLEEGNAMASKWSRGSADMYRLIGADKPLSRYASRGAADMLLGPTWGKIEALKKITGSAGAGEWTESDTSAVRRMVPMQNLFWMRGLFNQVEEATNGHFGIEMRPKEGKQNY